MTDTPPPDEPGRQAPRPADSPSDAPTESIGDPRDDETSHLHAGPPLPGAGHPGPPADEWPPQPVGGDGRVRRVVRRVRGSRVALAVIGVLVAAGLVAGGAAIGAAGHDGGGRGERNSSQRGGNDGGGNAGNDDRAGGGRGDRGRGGNSDDNGNRNGDRNGNRNDAGAANRGNDSNDGSATGTRQQVLGTVTAISSTSITLRTSGGNPSYPITASTPVSRGGSAASVTDLKVGDAVVVRVVIASAGAAPVVASISAS